MAHGQQLPAVFAVDIVCEGTSCCLWIILFGTVEQHSLSTKKSHLAVSQVDI